MQALLTAPTNGIQQRDFADSPMLRKLLRFNPQFSLHRSGSQDRATVENYIADVFAHAYGAQVGSYAPFLMSMSCAGSLSAAAGIRPAESDPLFLEQYLDNPIEQVLGNRYGHEVERAEIFELGNLAALRPGVCQLIYLIMAGVIERTHLNYAVFAANRQVLKGVNRLGFDTELLAPADPARLGDDAASWGSYYASEPQVMVIDLRTSMQHIRELPLPSILLKIYESQIAELANHFNSTR